MQCKTYSYKSTTFFTNCYILIADQQKRTANKLFLLKKCTDNIKLKFLHYLEYISVKCVKFRY